MDSRILLCGVAMAAFVLTLAFFSWHEGLWRSDAAPVARAAAEAPGSVAPATPSTAAPPATVATNSAPPPPTPAQSEPSSTPDDSGEIPARRDRGAGRGSRSR